MIKTLKLKNQEEILIALGIQDRKLRALEKNFKVTVFVKYNEDGDGAELSIKGTNSRVDKALAKLQKDLTLNAEKRPLDLVKDSRPFVDNIVFRPEHARPIEARSENQKSYIEAVFANDLVISSGPAGTGKTFLACACALRALELGLVERIIVTRPIVEAGEKLGFLPGDINEKTDPYLRPIYDAFYNMLGMERFNSLKYNNILEIVPLAYMRGRTLEKAFIILDEAQFLKNSVLDDLRIIFNFQMDSKDLAIIVLAGQTNFINQINRSNHEALRQRISVNYHLEGLGANEIKDYIVSRLSAAGCNEPLFADDCFDLLYSMTNGHPREINSICRMCLISAASKENKFITKEDIFNAHKEVSIISN